MSGISLAEYDPAAAGHRLHALLKVAVGSVAELDGKVRRLCPGATVSYDPEGERLLVAFPEAGDRGAYLRMLVALLDDYSGAPAGTAPELLETRLVAVQDGNDPLPSFSRHFRLLTDPSQVVASEASLLLAHGTSFGSGHHPSTRLAMAALDHLADLEPFPGRVLDVGCGSGILALACGLLGAAAVLGVDIDTEALAVAAGNAEANRLADRVRFSARPVADLTGPYDLLAANVSGAVMSGLAGDFSRLVGPGGWLVVSGLQGRQLGEMVETLGGLGFALVEEFHEGPWRAGLLRLSV